MLSYNIQQIGARIKTRREYLHLTQIEVAKKVGINKGTLSRYENGRIERPKLPVIESIASALSVRPDWLLGIVDDPTPYTDKCSDGLSSDESKLVDIYRSVTEQGQQEMMAHADYIGERYKKKPLRIRRQGNVIYCDFKRR